MANLAMSLDEIIEKTGRGKGKGKGRGRGSSRGRGRGGSSVVVAKPQPTIVKKAAPTLSSMSAQKAALTTAGGLTTGTKLRVGNLDFGVSEQDIQELFSEVGELKSVELATNPSGGSKGFAFVVYKRKADATNAVEKYNGVPLDNKPLKITMVNTATGITPAAATIKIDASRGTRTVTVVGSAGASGRGGRGGRGGRDGRGVQPAARGAARGAGRGEGRGAARGRGGRGGKKEEKPKPTYDDLDADLENYKMSTD